MRWTIRIVWDVVLSGILNRSFVLPALLLLLLVLGLVIVAAQVSAPFIYTLF